MHFKATKQDFKSFNIGFLSKSLDPESNRVGLNFSLHLLRHQWQCLPMDLTADNELQKLFMAIMISNLAKDVEVVQSNLRGGPIKPTVAEAELSLLRAPGNLPTVGDEPQQSYG